MDSAKGWAGTIRFNKGLWQQFQAFYARPDTFSLGVCNGCQLMALLGWVPANGVDAAAPLLEDAAQPRFVHNASGRFESRWAQVRVEEGSPAVMLRGMGGTQVGVWCAHGEGRAHFPSAAIKQRVMDDRLAPIRCALCAVRATRCCRMVCRCQLAAILPPLPRPSPLASAPLCTALHSRSRAHTHAWHAGTAMPRAPLRCSTPPTPMARPMASPRCAPPTAATWP